MISPVLSFTAEEIWAAMPAVARDAESVHLSSWYNENPQFINNELGAKWDKIIKLRKEVNKVLEKARQGENRIIGNSLDAEVTLVLSNEEYKELANETELLEMVFIVSKLSFGSITDDTFTESEELKGIFVKVTHAPGEKCERCWKYSEELGTHAEHQTTCPRCTGVLINN
jgi:isoleucyl-tRNA synthetase